MKPSLDQLKSQRECDRQFAEYHQRTADERRRAVSDLDAKIAAEEEREAKAKEWPQEGERYWFVCPDGSVATDIFRHVNTDRDIAAMGNALRSTDDARLVRDFLRSRPRGWLLAMAKLGEMDGHILPEHKNPTVTRTFAMTWSIDKWNALTEDERAALLGQG